MTTKTLSLLSLAALATLTGAAAADTVTTVTTTTEAPPTAPATATAPVAAPVAAPAPTTAPGFIDMRPSAQAPVGEVDDGGGWHRPAGRRFSHGFRVGWTYIANYEKPTRDGGMSLKQEFGLKTPNMMLLGYEGFYRIVGHSWLNVLMVGNVTVAGLEQSKFIPAASGLIGMEFDHSFQVGVGVNLTPDMQSPSHMIAAAGWTPTVGSIQTPFHVFYVPDADGNNRMGATVGMTW
jgi:hypothetical protein